MSIMACMSHSLLAMSTISPAHVGVPIWAPPNERPSFDSSNFSRRGWMYSLYNGTESVSPCRTPCLTGKGVPLMSSHFAYHDIRVGRVYRLGELRVIHKMVQCVSQHYMIHNVKCFWRISRVNERRNIHGGWKKIAIFNLQLFRPEKASAVLGVCVTCIVGACGSCLRVFTTLWLMSQIPGARTLKKKTR